jgi:hypothetical protein
MVVITPTIAVYDLEVSDPDTDAALLKIWEDGLAITHVYGWAVTPISNSILRYTIFYD